MIDYRQEIENRGETPVVGRLTPAPGDRVRAMVKYGRLFGGSVIEGDVVDMWGPREPLPSRIGGIPLHDPGSTQYLIANYTWDFMPGRAPSKDSICFDRYELVFLVPKAPAAEGQPTCEPRSDG